MSKAQASLEFLLVFSALISIIAFFAATLSSFNLRSENSLDFLAAKSNSLNCALAIDSLSSNSAFSLPQKLSCFSDSNNSIASKSGGRVASIPIIPQARISSFGNDFFLEVEGFAHYQ